MVADIAKAALLYDGTRKSDRAPEVLERDPSRSDSNAACSARTCTKWVWRSTSPFAAQCQAESARGISRSNSSPFLIGWEQDASIRGCRA